MPPVRIAPPGQQAGIARIEVPATPGASSGSGAPRPVRLQALADGAARVLDARGGSWSGRRADVKPDLHWLLRPMEDGSYEATPVRAWYEFNSHVPAAGSRLEARGASGRAAGGGSGGAAAKRPAEAGTAELEREAGLCNEMANRWEAMLERRQTRQGMNLTARAMRETMRALARRDPWEALKASKGEQAYPELEERIKDETGLRKQRRKQRKALHREARATNDAEDEAVPETANSLLQLKPEHGEGGWEFSDKEEFSDDDEEKWDFDDQIECAAANAEAPSADEDEAEEAEKGDLLTTHGHNIEALLQTYNGGVDLAEAGAVGGEEGAAAGSSGSEASEPEAPPPARRTPAALRAEAGAAKEPAAVAAASARGLGSRAAAAGAAVVMPAAPLAPSARGTPPGPPAAAPAPPAATPAAAPAGGREVLREKVVACLRERGGTCRAQDAMRAMGLRERDPGSTFYKEVLAVLKEVATVERVPGDAAQRVLVLRSQYKARP